MIPREVTDSDTSRFLSLWLTLKPKEQGSLTISGNSLKLNRNSPLKLNLLTYQ
jgi:hypothetical protein